MIGKTAQQPVILKKEAILFTLTFSFSLMVYLITMPKGLTWAHFGVDGGELIAASVTVGIPHPPGYPLYVLMGKLFSLLPIGSIAYRFNLLSAVAMATATGVLTLTSFSLYKGAARAYTAIALGLSFAFSSLVWQQAIITEVYGLFMAFVALTIWSVATKKSPLLIGLFWGLAIVSHLTAFLLVLLLFVWGRRRLLNGRFLLGWLLGLSLFLLLPIFALSNSPIVWGDPSTISGWTSIVTAQIYQTLPFQATAISRSRLLAWGAIWLNQLTLVGPLFLLISLWQLLHSPQNEKWVGWGLFFTAVCYFGYALTYNTPDAIVFSLPAIYLLLILIGAGLKFLEAWAILLPIALLLLNFNAVNISQDQFVHQQLEHVFAEAPQHALIETNGDPILFALWYAMFAEHRREDILVVDRQLFEFGWYRARLGRAYPSLVIVNQPNFALFKGIFAEKRPYCTITYPESVTKEIEMDCSKKP